MLQTQNENVNQVLLKDLKNKNKNYVLADPKLPKLILLFFKFDMCYID